MQKIKQLFKHQPEPQVEEQNAQASRPVYAGKHTTERTFIINPEISSHVQMEGLGGKPSAIREDKEKEKAKNKILEEFQMKKDFEKAEAENGRKPPPTLPQGGPDQLNFPLLPPGTSVPTTTSDSSLNVPSMPLPPVNTAELKDQKDQLRSLETSAKQVYEVSEQPMQRRVQREPVVEVEQFVSPFPHGNPVTAYYLSQEANQGPQLAPPPASLQTSLPTQREPTTVVVESRALPQYETVQRVSDYQPVDRREEIERIKLQVLNQQVPFTVNQSHIPPSRPV